MSPERRNRNERHTRDELRLEPRVADREIEVGLRRHVQHRRGDRAQRALDVAVEPRRRADVVALPGARLQDEIVRVVVGEERPAPIFDLLLERAIRRVGLPHLTAPPLLRIQPAEPDHAVRFDALAGRRRVVAAVERRVRGERGDLSFEPHDAMRPRFRRARRRDNAVGEGGMTDRPLERLLRTHREADDRAHVRDLQIAGEQTAHRFDVVANRHDRKARSVERLRRVAGRRGEAVAEQFGGDEKQPGRVQRPVGSDQPLVAVMVRHVVRRQQHDVVARGVQAAVRAVDDPRLGQRDAALGTEVLDHELVMVGGVRRNGRHRPLGVLRLCVARGGEHQREEEVPAHTGILLLHFACALARIRAGRSGSGDVKRRRRSLVVSGFSRTCQDGHRRIASVGPWTARVANASSSRHFRSARRLA